MSSVKATVGITMHWCAIIDLAAHVHSEIMDKEEHLPICRKFWTKNFPSPNDKHTEVVTPFCNLRCGHTFSYTYGHTPCTLLCTAVVTPRSVNYSNTFVVVRHTHHVLYRRLFHEHTLDDDFSCVFSCVSRRSYTAMVSPRGFIFLHTSAASMITAGWSNRKKREVALCTYELFHDE